MPFIVGRGLNSYQSLELFPVYVHVGISGRHAGKQSGVVDRETPIGNCSNRLSKSNPPTEMVFLRYCFVDPATC